MLPPNSSGKRSPKLTPRARASGAGRGASEVYPNIALPGQHPAPHLGVGTKKNRGKYLKPLVDLTGRVAIVPGASGGIGSAVAEVLAECGADLFLGYGSNQDRVNGVFDYAHKLGRRAKIHPFDATDPAAINAWVQRGISEFQRVDILANCLGWKEQSSFVLFAEQDPSSWRKCIDIELMACIHLADAVIHHMLERNYGRIITVGSDSQQSR